MVPMTSLRTYLMGILDRYRFMQVRRNTPRTANVVHDGVGANTMMALVALPAEAVNEVDRYSSKTNS